MKHASVETLRELVSLLEQLRSLPGLVERTPGSFYHRSTAFLHFHEDPAGLFADAKLDLKEFERHCVSTPAQQKALLKAVVTALAGSNGRGRVTSSR
jgi:hypothetical protein